MGEINKKITTITKKSIPVGTVAVIVKDKTKNFQILEDNTGEYLHDPGQEDFFNRAQKG